MVTYRSGADPSIAVTGDVPEELALDKHLSLSNFAPVLNSLAKYGFVVEHINSAIGQSGEGSFYKNNTMLVCLLSKDVVDSSDNAQTLRGDVNEDGRVSVEDVSNVVDIILNTEESKE